MSSTAPNIFSELEFVAIDLETTGGDPSRDRIIEVGAARFRNGEVVDTFSRLVQPGRRLPPFIVQLTGIDDAMLADAPSIEEVLVELKHFLGGRPLVAHNARFEASFLGRLGIEAPFWDSLFWYQLVNPSGPHNLRAASLHLASAEEQHRALPDALAAGRVFARAVAEVAGYGEALLATLAALGVGSDDPDLALLARLGQPQDLWRRRLYRNPKRSWPAAIPSLAELVAKQGLERREPQLALADAIEEAFESESILLAEAPTGVGKSLAYLLPGLRQAQRGRRLLVSTYTKTLQDQILIKDLAAIARAVGVEELPVVPLKGQRNYLCLLRFARERARAREEGSSEERKDVARLLVWADSTSTGDQGEVHVPGDTWARVEVRRETCLRDACPFFQECFYFEARRRAQEQPVVLLNHALLIQEARNEEGLVDGAYLVVDEAHELEQAATSALTESVSDEEVERLLREIRPLLQTTYAEGLEAAADVLGRLRSAVYRFGTERLTERTRQSAAGETLLNACQDLSVALAALAAPLEAATATTLFPEERGLVDVLADLVRRLEAFRSQDPGDPSYVVWTEWEERRGRIRLQRAPVFPDEFLREQLWPRPRAAVLTSATLTVAGSFAHMERLLGLEEEPRLLKRAFPSPFFYREQALLGLLEGVPDPQQETAFLQHVAEAVSELVAAAHGRSLVLFTSHRHLREVAERVRPLLQEHGITVLAQGIDGPRRRLLEALKDGRRMVVVFGAQSFWEGVDIAGPELQLVIIVRLPFRPPDDPVVAARLERWQANGSSPFLEWQLPDAVLRFKQGFGRLIRSSYDIGVVVVLDPRIQTARYGRVFLASLPETEVVRGDAKALAAHVRRFLGIEDATPRPS